MYVFMCVCAHTYVCSAIVYIHNIIALNSRDRQGMYGMQHFYVPRNPPYNRL